MSGSNRWSRRPTTCSHPLVEATLLQREDGRGYCIALVNYDVKPAKDLSVVVRLPGKLKLAGRSSITETAVDGGLRIAFKRPLEKFAFLEVVPAQ